MNAKYERLILDVLKPHEPNALEFARSIAALGYRVQIKVAAVDDKTQTLVVSVEGVQIDFERVKTTINDLGGALHSIDEVEVDAELTDQS